MSCTFLSQYYVDNLLKTICQAYIDYVTLEKSSSGYIFNAACRQQSLNFFLYNTVLVSNDSVKQWKM